MKTSKIIINSYKDTSLEETIQELGIKENDNFKVFEYGEFMSAEIIVDENLNIIGGKIIPFKI